MATPHYIVICSWPNAAPGTPSEAAANFCTDLIASFYVFDRRAEVPRWKYSALRLRRAFDKSLATGIFPVHAKNRRGRAYVSH
jgi:hypothetical protein